MLQTFKTTMGNRLHRDILQSQMLKRFGQRQPNYVLGFCDFSVLMLSLIKHLLKSITDIPGIPTTFRVTKLQYMPESERSKHKMEEM